MKKMIQFVALLMITSLTGCASTRAYFVDRGRDAADVVTLTGGWGFGAKIRASCLSAGLLCNKDKLGLRSGTLFLGPSDSLDILNFTTIGMEEFVANYDVPYERGKSVSSVTIFPIFSIGEGPTYYTQLEAVIGLGPSLRLGFNPGELLDFFMGWLTIDIYDDDLARKSQKEQESLATRAEQPNRDK